MIANKKKEQKEKDKKVVPSLDPEREMGPQKKHHPNQYGDEEAD
jgi:hypothetical protein